MLESVLESSLWRLVSRLPGLLLRRIFTAAWLEKHINVDIRSRHQSVEIYIPDCPRVTIWLNVQNLTHFPIELDRIHGKFYYAIEIARLVDLRRRTIGPGKSVEIMLEGNIGGAQYSRLPFEVKHNAGNCRLELSIEVNTKLHNFALERNLDGIKPNIANIQLLEKNS